MLQRGMTKKEATGRAKAFGGAPGPPPFLYISLISVHTGTIFFLGGIFWGWEGVVDGMWTSFGGMVWKMR